MSCKVFFYLPLPLCSSFPLLSPLFLSSVSVAPMLLNFGSTPRSFSMGPKSKHQRVSLESSELGDSSHCRPQHRSFTLIQSSRQKLPNFKRPNYTYTFKQVAHHFEVLLCSGPDTPMFLSTFLCIKTDEFKSFVNLSSACILRFMEILHFQLLLQMFSWVLIFYLVVLFSCGNSER